MKNWCLTDPAVRKGAYWPRIEACYSRTWEQYDMPPHFHNREELMYVLKGWCRVHLFDYAMDPLTQDIRITGGRTERLGPGEFIYLEQGLLHALEVPETSYMLNAEFRVTEDAGALLTIGGLAEKSPDVGALLGREAATLRGNDDSGLLLRPLEQAIFEFSKPLHGDPVLADVLMAEMLLRMAGILRARALRSNALVYARGAADYISAHIDEDIRIDAVAARVGVAPGYLQRIFKQAIGMTIIEYLNHLRVEQSKRLLMYTDDSIIDVAVACGFNSRQHFFRVFSATTGMSPQQYRQEHPTRHVQHVFLFDDVEDHSYDRNGRRR